MKRPNGTMDAQDLLKLVEERDLLIDDLLRQLDFQTTALRVERVLVEKLSRRALPSAPSRRVYQ